MDRSVGESVNPRILELLNQLMSGCISQSINHLICVNQAANQSACQSENQWIELLSQRLNHSVSQSDNHLLTQSVIQRTDVSESPSMTPSIRESVSPRIRTQLTW